MRVLTVIQARTGSSRLPGKVLRPLGAGNVLTTMWERVSASRLKGTAVIATTTASSDDVIVELCRHEGIPCFRGHETDLLDRHYEAMVHYGADVVVKIPSDCPLIDPRVIDRVLAGFLAEPERYDYFGNLHPQSYPDGNDVEVMRADALATAWREATRLIEREHTTPFLWENPQRFRLGNIAWETNQDLSRSHRWTLDYLEDYELIVRIWDALGPGDPLFPVEAIVAYLQRHPEVQALNAQYRGDSWYSRHRAELRSFGGTSGIN